MFQNINWKDIAIRALKTFAQGFLGSLTITVPTMHDFTWTTLSSLLIAAVSAGASAVWNLLVEVSKKSSS